MDGSIGKTGHAAAMAVMTPEAKQVVGMRLDVAIRAAMPDNPDLTTVELEGLNHLFQSATTGSVGEYRDIEETFDPAALALISDWIRQRFVKP